MLREAEIAVEELPEKAWKYGRQLGNRLRWRISENYTLPIRQQKERLVLGIRKTETVSSFV